MHWKPPIPYAIKNLVGGDELVLYGIRELASQHDENFSSIKVSTNESAPLCQSALLQYYMVDTWIMLVGKSVPGGNLLGPEFLVVIFTSQVQEPTLPYFTWVVSI